MQSVRTSPEGAPALASWPAWGRGGLLLAAAATILLAPWPVAGVAMAIYLLIAARWPVGSLALVVLSLPFYLLGRPFGRLEISPTEIGILLSTVAVVLGRLGEQRRYGGWIPGCPDRGGTEGMALGAPGEVLPSPPGRWFGQLLGRWIGDPILAGTVILIVVAGALSLTTSVAVRESLRSFRTIIVEPALFYFLVVTQVRRRRELLVLVGALVVAGVLISLVGFWQYLTNENIITAEEGLRRIRGFYGSPNNLALFLGRALPVALALALWRREGRLLLGSAAVIMAIALVLTFSSGAWVAVGASCFAVAALHGARTRRVALAAALTGAFALGVAALRIPRIGSHFDLQSGTGFIRLEVWQSALHLLRDHPIRGIGLDNFLYYYQHGYRLPGAWREPDLSHPHNLVFDFWLSLGLPGVLLLIVGLARLGQLISQRWRQSDATERAIFAGALGATIDTVAHGLVDNSFFLVDLAVLFWLIFAIVAIVCREQASSARPAASAERTP